MNDNLTTVEYRYLLELVMSELMDLRNARDCLLIERKQVEQRIRSYRENEVRLIRERDEAEQIAQTSLDKLEQLTQETCGLQDRAERAEADNAALFQAAWEVVWAPVTTGHADLASKTYWARRRTLADMLSERINGGYPGRQLLAEREKLMEQIEKLTTTTGKEPPATP